MKRNGIREGWSYILWLLCVLCPLVVKGQSTHQVAVGETLFGISRQYGVTIEALEKANNIAVGTATIQVGQRLIIPQLTKDTMGVAGTHCREMHRVKKKETLYGIAQQYGITVEMLQEANPEVKAVGYTLKKGDFLCIPFKSTTSTIAPARIVAPPVGLNQIRVGVLLPFKGHVDEALQAKEFYQGFLLAVDSMKQMGVSVEVVAMNLSSVADMAKIEQSSLLREAHLLFAPFEPAQVAWVADYAKKYKIATVVPYTSRLSAIKDNPYLYMLNAPSERKDDYAIETILKHFATQRFVILEAPNGNERAFIAKFKAELVKHGRGYTEVHPGVDNKALKTELEKHINAIVVPNASDEATLQAFINRMKVLKQTYNTPFTLLGYPQWLLSVPAYVAAFNSLDTYIYSPFYASPYDARTKAYNARFLATYGQSPTPTLPNNSMTGFDAGMYFMLALKAYGTGLGHKPVKYEGLQNQFVFVPYATGGGYINRYIRLIHYY